MLSVAPCLELSLIVVLALLIIERTKNLNWAFVSHDYYGFESPHYSLKLLGTCLALAITDVLLYFFS